MPITLAGAKRPCPHCGGMFLQSGGLAKHVAMTHPEEWKASIKPKRPKGWKRLRLPEDMTIFEALERWRVSRMAAPATARGYACVARALATAGLRNVSDLTVDNFGAYLARRLETLSESAANVHWAAVCAILAQLEKHELFPLEVLARLRRLKPKRKARARLSATFLLPEDLNLLCSTARRSKWPRIETVVKVGALAGLRAAELARMRWEDVDFHRKTIAVRLRPELGEFGRIKTGRERLVPLCDELRGHLQAIRKPAGYVFHQRWAHKRGVVLPFAQVRCLRKELAKVSEEAGLRGVNFHLLRHTRASLWIQGGVPMAKIAKWLGHSTDVLELHYAGLLDGYDPDAERVPEPRPADSPVGKTRRGRTAKVAP